MIGAELFQRPVGYDTANDPVVRVKATEVRKKLAMYYLERSGKPGVRIDLPSGTYVPRFLFEPENSAGTIRFRQRVIQAISHGRLATAKESPPAMMATFSAKKKQTRTGSGSSPQPLPFSSWHRPRIWDSVSGGRTPWPGRASARSQSCRLRNLRGSAPGLLR